MNSLERIEQFEKNLRWVLDVYTKGIVMILDCNLEPNGDIRVGLSFNHDTFGGMFPAKESIDKQEVADFVEALLICENILKEVLSAVQQSHETKIS